MDAAQPKLLTFAPMIDSEFSRFLLNHYGIGYREDRHLFGWASILALFRGGTLQIPLLTGSGLRLAGPEAIAAHFETACAPDKQLRPANAALSSQVDADMARFHGTLADATAAIGYYYLLPQRALMMEPFCRGIPKGEARVLDIIYPLFAGLFRLLLGLDAKHTGTGLEQTRAIFDETDRRIADGRAYLVGDRLTLADLALATAAAPVLLPEGYGSPMPPFDLMPAELRAIVVELRQRPTARFVQSIFSKHRSG